MPLQNGKHNFDIRDSIVGNVLGVEHNVMLITWHYFNKNTYFFHNFFFYLIKRVIENPY